MRGRGALMWGAWLLVVVMVLAAGCAKKQTVRSGEQPAAAAAQAPAAQAPPAPEKITTEAIKPEAPAAEKAGAMTARAAEAAVAQAVTEEQKSPFADIHFDFDKSFIRPDAKPILEEIAAWMKKNAGAKVQIEGNCDERGTAEYNMALGERRAESARSYLVSLGASQANLSTVSFGKEKPIDPGHTEEAWAKNRRDHFVRK
ncbi:MAG: peptidoglycan-associated lipoprotein Pal [Deltaproteobacteria bacterium]|nr:peptidoglycan-associated lipoprotein Pal [Deltaproteobacteria bacterium]